MDITENQLQGSSDNYDAIEDLQKKSYVPYVWRMLCNFPKNAMS